MRKKSSQWTMDPTRFMKELDFELESPAPTRREGSGKRDGGGFAGSLIKSLGPDIQKSLPEAAPRRSRSARGKKSEETAPSKRLFLQVVRDVEKMSDDVFLLLYLQLSKEFERRYSVEGWCERVLRAEEGGGNVVLDYDLETQGLPQFPASEAKGD